MAVYKDKKTGKWYFRVYVFDPITNERVQVSRHGFELKREAVEAEATLIRDYPKRSQIIDIRVPVTINDFKEFEKNRLKITSYQSAHYRIDKYIADYFGNMLFRNIDKRAIDKWYKDLKESKLTTGYKNTILNLLKRYFNFVSIKYKIDVPQLELYPSFVESIAKDERTRKIYDEDEFKIFISKADFLSEVIFSVLFYTGVRIGELRGLKWIDIDLQNDTVNVNRSVTTKVQNFDFLETPPKTKSSIRSIFIPKSLTNLLKNYKEREKSDEYFDENWFVFGRQKPIGETTIKKRNLKLAKASNLHYVTNHGFRHSYITLLYKKDFPAEFTKSQVGHSSIAVTLDIYTHIEKDQIKKKIDEKFN